MIWVDFGDISIIQIQLPKIDTFELTNLNVSHATMYVEGVKKFMTHHDYFKSNDIY